MSKLTKAALPADPENFHVAEADGDNEIGRGRSSVSSGQAFPRRCRCRQRSAALVDRSLGLGGREHRDLQRGDERVPAAPLRDRPDDERRRLRGGAVDQARRPAFGVGQRSSRRRQSFTARSCVFDNSM